MAGKIIINVGRQFGSGGKSVAAALGAKLGIPVYDQELLAQAASDSGYSEAFFARHDEKKNFFDMAGLSSLSGRFGLAENYLNDNELFRIQSEVIMDIAQKGSAIFVGRASDYVLRDMKTLDVFVTAPLQDRVKRVAARMGVSEPDAETLIAKKDKGRKAFYDFFTFGEWGVASNYDLCVDSSILGIDGTADLIISFAKAAGLL